MPFLTSMISIKIQLDRNKEKVSFDNILIKKGLKMIPFRKQNSHDKAKLEILKISSFNWLSYFRQTSMFNRSQKNTERNFE